MIIKYVVYDKKNPEKQLENQRNTKHENNLAITKEKTAPENGKVGMIDTIYTSSRWKRVYFVT